MDDERGRRRRGRRRRGRRRRGRRRRGRRRRGRRRRGRRRHDPTPLQYFTLERNGYAGATDTRCSERQ
ncbi:MAG: hypothetical protein CMI16_06755 [Opitutaceae bacterium]|nr:hypothetical protein [Opitutaceae bacterium]